MPQGFYDYMYGANAKNAEAAAPRKKVVQEDAVVQDEAIGSPWTHRFTVYCSNPSTTFLEELKAKDGVVAVYVKEKAEKSAPEDTPPNK